MAIHSGSRCSGAALVRHALEHRAGQGAAVVAHSQSDERAADVRVGVRRSLA